MLKDSYFRIVSQSTSDSDTTFKVKMLPDHPVYQGHFPGRPVSPGVCNMQMLKECAELLIGHETLLSFVRQYRMLAVMSPSLTPEVEIRMSLTEADGTNQHTLTASVWQANRQLIDFKGTLTTL